MYKNLEIYLLWNFIKKITVENLYFIKNKIKLYKVHKQVDSTSVFRYLYNSSDYLFIIIYEIVFV